MTNIPDSLYKESLSFLKKIENNRKPYLISRKIGLICFTALFGFVFFSLIYSILGQTFNIPEKSYYEGISTWGFIVRYIVPFLFPIGVYGGGIMQFASYFFFKSILEAQTEILSKILHSLNSDFKFAGKKILQSKMTKPDILRSGFFIVKDNNRNGLQIISKGTIKTELEGVKVEFADLNVVDTSISPITLLLGPFGVMPYLFFMYLKNLLSKRKDLYMNGFKGLFFSADFHKDLKGFTIVLPDNYEKHVGFLAKPVQELLKKMGELVYLEDPRFEKEFVIYSTDQIEARYILSFNFMEKILELKKKMNGPLLLSFKKSKMFIAMPDPEGVLEVSLKENVVNPEALEKPYKNLQTCLEIVKAFGLNRKIYPKQKNDLEPESEPENNSVMLD